MHGRKDMAHSGEWHTRVIGLLPVLPSSRAYLDVSRSRHYAGSGSVPLPGLTPLAPSHVPAGASRPRRLLLGSHLPRRPGIAWVSTPARRPPKRCWNRRSGGPQCARSSRSSYHASVAGRRVVPTSPQDTAGHTSPRPSMPAEARAAHGHRSTSSACIFTCCACRISGVCTRALPTGRPSSSAARSRSGRLRKKPATLRDSG